MRPRNFCAWIISIMLAFGLFARAVPLDAAKDASLMLALGNLHTCALIDGGVSCWGWGPALGTGSDTDRATPAGVSGLSSGVQALAAGRGYTCALLETGGVMCWGSNGDGQLGDGSETDRLAPVAVSGLGGSARAIAAADTHTCAVLASGHVQCWGLNANGQLGAGDGVPYQTSTPQDVVGIENAVALTAGTAHTCALLETGGIKCWGYNYYGSLGNGNTADQNTPVDVVGLSSGVVQMGAGYLHTCALLDSGAVRCWGLIGSTRSNTPQEMPGLGGGVAGIAVGNNHYCALGTDGGVLCAGANGEGQLGDGTTTSRDQPAPVQGLPSGVTDIAAGARHSCAVIGDAARCWGDDTYGQLGIGNSTRGLVVLSELWGTAYTDISVAGHVCAVTGGGAAQCWGSNYQGELGIGDPVGLEVAWSSPQSVVGLAGGVSRIVAGANYSCAVVNGGARCWGYNDDGQLGTGDTAATTTPAPVSGLSGGVTEIVVSQDPDYQHTCAIVNGGAKCWGYNYLGQLGNGEEGNLSPETTPVDVVGLGSGVSAVAVGGDHSCAVVSGAVKCWGVGYYGALGNGVLDSYDRYPTPQDVVDLTGNAIAVTAGSDFTCAIVDGAAKCWGRNQYGQLGNGTGIHSARPVQVAGLTSDVTALSAFRTQVCAVQAGEVLCWGSGFSTTPQAISRAPGGYHWVTTGGTTCWLSDSQAICSGRDQDGRLGAGRVDVRPTPVPVLGLGPGQDLYAHYDSAQPGSVLNVIGANFPPGWRGALWVNGQALGQAAADGNGLWRAAIKTAGTPVGNYRLTAVVDGACVVDTFALRDSAPLRGPEGAAALIVDLAGAPAQTAAIGMDGGALMSSLDGTAYIFPAGAFTAPVTVTHTAHRPWQLPATGPLVAVGPAFDVTAVYTSTGQPAPIAPGQAFTVTVPYADAGVAVPETLGLWWWDVGANAWSQAGIVSAVDIAQKQVTAQVTHLSLFAVLGATQRVYLPLVLR
jgi:alpha-tubulin suppressor-like RCC1 family protein